MDFINEISNILMGYIMGLSPFVVLLIVIFITVALGIIEPWLGKTEKTKAGSIVALVVGIIIDIFKKVLSSIKSMKLTRKNDK